jgi:adenylate cyclase
MEIERKFLVKSLPPGWKPASGSPIRQGYFSLRDQGVEIRLREKASKCFITIKAGRGRVRLEEEIPISRKRFETLWPLVRVASVAKKRYRIPRAGRVIELDIYQGRRRGLMVAEVEFRSVGDAKAFQPPPWLGREITGNRRYANEYLARSEVHTRRNRKVWHLNSRKRNRSASR